MKENLNKNFKKEKNVTCKRLLTNVYWKKTIQDTISGNKLQIYYKLQICLIKNTL